MSGPVIQSGMRMRLALTLALVTLVAVAAVFGLAYKMGPSPYATHVVNVAGQHRLFSQEIAKIALLMEREEDSANHGELRESIARFRRANEELNSPEMKAFLEQIGEQSAAVRMQEKTALFLRAAEAYANASPAARRQMLPDFLLRDEALLREASVLTAALSEGSRRKLREQTYILAAGVTVIGLLAVVIAYALLSPFIQILDASEKSRVLLRGQKLKILEAIENCADSVIITDETHHIEYANPAFEALTGYSRTDVIGKTPRILQSGLHSSEFYKSVWAQIAEHGFWNGDFTDKKADGSTCILNSTLAAVRINGAVAGYIGIQRDVSRHRQLEEEVERARDDAVRAMRTRNQFYAMLSHDFRAPLYSIIAAASLFGNHDGSRADGGAVSAIQTSAGVVLDLINNSLDFSRMETGKLELVSRVFPLRRPVLEAEQIIRQQAQKKGLVFQVDLKEDLPATVLGDEARLRRVLLNLLGNAVKFTSEGRVTLRANAYGHEISFAVEDTGPGIPPTERERIFRPFEQNGNHDGTGLGLAICKELVTLMGGSLTLEPQVQTCFRVRLPLVSVQPGSGTPGKHGNSRRILIVDDNAISARVNRQSLMAAGYFADSVEDAAKALDKLHTESYDLILMDYQLPDRNGFETTRAIRQWELSASRQRHIILTFTAAAEDLNTEQAYNAGVDAVLSRSLARDDLLTLIDGFLSTHAPM